MNGRIRQTLVVEVSATTRDEDVLTILKVTIGAVGDTCVESDIKLHQTLPYWIHGRIRLAELSIYHVTCYTTLTVSNWDSMVYRLQNLTYKWKNDLIVASFN